jgi:hypothetical protein
MHKRMIGVLLAAIIIIAGFTAAELYVRAKVTTHESSQEFFGKYPLRPYVLPLTRVRVAADIALNQPNAYYQPDATLGWRIKPYAVSERKEYTYRVNSAGMRGTTEYTFEKPANKTRIALFGDSYVHGDAVNDTQTWAAILAQKTGAEVLNFGVGGYGIDQAYLLWKHVGRNYSPDIVIIGFQPENCRRNVNTIRSFYNQPVPFSKPRFALENSKLKRVQGFPIDPRELELAITQFPSEKSAYEYFYKPADFDAKNVFWKSKIIALAAALRDEARAPARERVFYDTGNPEAELCFALLRAFAEEAGKESAVYFLHMPNEEHATTALQHGKMIAQQLLDRLPALAPVIDPAPALLNALQNTTERVYYDWHYTPYANSIVAETVAQAIATRELNAS